MGALDLPVLPASVIVMASGSRYVVIMIINHDIELGPQAIALDLCAAPLTRTLAPAPQGSC